MEKCLSSYNTLFSDTATNGRLLTRQIVGGMAAADGQGITYNVKSAAMLKLKTHGGNDG